MIQIPGETHHKVVNLAPLYELLIFDGTYYRLKRTEEIAGKALSFEFGCIFEIGRLLNERGIYFHDLI